MATDGTKQKPVLTKGFPVKIAVFKFQNDDGRPNYSVGVTRSFRRDENSPWETSQFLSAQDLLPAQRLLGEAYDFIQACQQKAYEERREQTASADVPY